MAVKNTLCLVDVSFATKMRQMLGAYGCKQNRALLLADILRFE